MQSRTQRPCCGIWAPELFSPVVYLQQPRPGRQAARASAEVLKRDGRRECSWTTSGSRRLVIRLDSLGHIEKQWPPAAQRTDVESRDSPVSFARQRPEARLRHRHQQSHLLASIASIEAKATSRSKATDAQATPRLARRAACSIVCCSPCRKVARTRYGTYTSSCIFAAAQAAPSPCSLDELDPKHARLDPVMGVARG